MSTRSDRAWRAALGDLDALLDLTTDGFAAPATAGARLGTWSLWHGDGRLPLSRASFAREFTRGSDVGMTELIADGETRAMAPEARPREARVLYRSVGAMDALRYERRRWRGRSSYGTGCPRADGDGRSAER